MAILLICLAIYSFIQIDSLKDRINELSVEIASVDVRLASTTDELQNTIARTRANLASEISAGQINVQTQLGTVQSRVGSLTGTLTTLQKLSRTDPELLKKYSKVYFLNENYVPVRLSEIPSQYQYSNQKQLLIHTDVMPRLTAMIETASSTGVKLYASSAYRSFDEQKALKSDYRITYGAGTANSFSADQGYSEHQLGTAVDFITNGLGGSLDGFDGTPAYEWMRSNAHKYGFALSYPKNNGYYVYEPWHWRYVGVKLATDLHNQNKNFYDLDQRAIDEYLVNIFD